MQRRRNLENQQIKLQRQNEQLQEQATKTQVHMSMKQELNQNIAVNKIQAQSRTLTEALETKKEKEINKQRLELLRKQEEEKAQNIKMMIKIQQREAQTKRQQQFVEKQYKARNMIEEKLYRESNE